MLQSLDLQACYGLEKIRLLDKHALGASLPDDFRLSRNIRINLLNAGIDHSLLEELSSNPRIGQVSGVDEMGGRPCESMFANIHRTMNSMMSSMDGTW